MKLKQPLTRIALYLSVMLAIVAQISCGTDTGTEPNASSESNSKTIVVYGASGKIGGLIVKEALERGHSVLGISRNPAKLAVDHANFTPTEGDITDPESIRSVTQGADAIVISVTGPGEGNLPENAMEARAAKAMISAFEGGSSTPHIIQVGGATTMFGSVEAMKENLPFPAEEGSPMHGMLFGHMVALQDYKASDISWTVITPPMSILGWSPGGLQDAETTKGAYRTSTTEFVTDSEGKSSIYVLDLAKAIIDEVENGKFVGHQVAVGY